MIDADISAQMLFQAADDPPRQRHLREQVEPPLAPADHLLHLADIDQRLAARRHPMQQTNRLLREDAVDFIKGPLLCRRQLEIDADIPRQIMDTVDHALFYSQNSFVDESL